MCCIMDFVAPKTKFAEDFDLNFGHLQMTNDKFTTFAAEVSFGRMCLHVDPEPHLCESWQPET